MRTMMVANTLVTDGNPSAKGAIGLKNTLSAAINITNAPTPPAVTSPAVTDVNGVIQFINSLGNGSIKTFSINPLNFNFSTKESGSYTAATYSITYPTGNVRTDSFGMQFEGGIVVKKLDTGKNVYNTTKILNVEVIGSNGVVTAADVKVAFKAAMATLISDGSTILPIKSVIHTAETSSVYTLNSTDWYIELTGDLRAFTLTKTKAVDEINSGAKAVAFEKELAPNSGYNNTLDKFEGAFADSNFIADASVVYDIITVTSMATAQRPLLPNAAGFTTQLHIYVPHSAKAAVYDKIVAYLTALKAANGAAVSIS